MKRIIKWSEKDWQSLFYVIYQNNNTNKYYYYIVLVVVKFVMIG